MSPRELVTEHLDLWTGAVTKKSRSGRGSNGKVALTGIKKLRELILELAIRGKLLPQNPKDDPASSLYARIKEVEHDLVANKTIRKAKNQSDIAAEEIEFQIPDNWMWTRLGSVGQIIGGGTPKSGEPSYWTNDGIKWLTPADLYGLKHKYISEGKRDISELGLEKSSAHLLPKGSVLFSSRAPIGYVAITTEELATNQGFKNCAPFIYEMNEFLYFFLKRSARQIDASASGTTFKEVSGSKVASIRVPLPPLEEQHRIVQKVDELMALCDRLEQQTSNQLEAHETLVDALLGTLIQSQNVTELADSWTRLAAHFDTLFTTEQSIDKLKQTVLQLAVMGRLVEQNPANESTSHLLQRVECEIKDLVKKGKIKKFKQALEIEGTEKPFSIPQSWEWVPLGNLSLHSAAGWSPKCLDTPRDDGRWGVLKVSAVTWGAFRPDENKELPSHLEPKPEYEIQPFDFLISRANTAELVARSVVVPNTAPRNLMMSDKIIRFAFSEQVEPSYINLFNNCSYARSYYLSVAGGTSSSMKNVSRAQVQSLEIPLPPQDEQQRIVQRVDELMALCGQLKKRLNQASETRCQLADTVVEAALG